MQLTPLFHPADVLVIGASNSPSNLGRNIVRNLLDFGYQGGIHLYGRRDGHLFGHRIHTSFDQLPDGIDMAVILVPAAHVPGLLEQCGRKGVKTAVIETGGFGEFDQERQELEQELLSIAERYGMRFVGPNCLGVICMESGLAVPFTSMHPPGPPGRTSLLAQSGGVGVFCLAAFEAANIELDRFVSMGNKLNLDECDLLEDLRTSSDPDCVCLYLEDVKRGRLLYQTIRECDFPVLVQKANTTDAGSRIARSHTASVAGDDRVLSAALKN